MTLVNLGTIILCPEYDDGNKECEYLLNTLNSVAGISSTIVIGLIGVIDVSQDQRINSIKNWNVGKDKTLLLIIGNNGSAEFTNKLLSSALDLKNTNKLDYIVYLKSGEALKNIESLSEILSVIHSNTISGLKIPIYEKEKNSNSDFKYNLRLIKADPQFSFNGTFEPELSSTLPIGKVNNDKNVLYIENYREGLSSSLKDQIEKSDMSDIRNLYYKALYLNKDYYKYMVTLSGPNPGQEEYFYDAYMYLTDQNPLDYAIKAYKLKKRLEPLIKIVNHFISEMNYDFAFIFAKKMLEIEDTNNIYNRDYVKWNLLARIGLVSLENPEHFIYGNMGAIRMIYTTNNIMQDTEILQKYKEMSKKIKEGWNILEKFDFSLKENLALMEDPKLAILHAVEDIKEI